MSSFFVHSNLICSSDKFICISYYYYKSSIILTCIPFFPRRLAKDLARSKNGTWCFLHQLVRHPNIKLSFYANLMQIDQNYFVVDLYLLTMGNCSHAGLLRPFSAFYQYFLRWAFQSRIYWNGISICIVHESPSSHQAIKPTNNRWLSPQTN